MSTFASKLNGLMQIAYVSNVNLAKAISINESHISRLRRGQRALPKRPTFLEPLSRYLSLHINTAEQASALRTLMQFNGSLDDKEALSVALCKWLKSEDDEPETFNTPVEGVISHASLRTHVEQCHLETDSYVYFGDECKRKAMTTMLEMAFDNEEVKTLYFYSDESWDWLETDDFYLKEWMGLMLQLIAQGKEVKVVFFLDRNLGDLIRHVTYWIRFMMTGKMKGYFYPRFADSLYNRSMFLATPVAALDSFTLKATNTEGWGYFTTNKQALEKLEEEQNAFLEHCLPMYETLKVEDGTLTDDVMEALRYKKSPIGYIHTVPDFYTMPFELLEEILDEESLEIIRPHWHDAQKLFAYNLGQDTIDEFIMDPALVLKKDEMPPMAFLSFLLQKKICHTKDQYVKHVEYMKSLSKTWTNYRVHKWDQMLENVFMIAKNNTRVLMVTIGEVISAQVINEQRLNNGIYDHLQNQTRIAPLL